jgi:hypothetical protein
MWRPLSATSKLAFYYCHLNYIVLLGDFRKQNVEIKLWIIFLRSGDPRVDVPVFSLNSALEVVLYLVIYKQISVK